MSYDIQIWSVLQPEFLGLPLKSEVWKNHGDAWVLESHSWQIIASKADRVLPEDMPDGILSAIPGIQFCTELRLQPIDAPESAKKKLLQIAGSLAKASRGVFLDCQTDELVTPKGLKRFLPKARTERFASLELGWWFLDDHIFSKDGIDGLLNIVETLIPEALPRRYGLYEPPQFLLKEQDREHLLNFLVENIDESPVLYTTRPILELAFSCTREKHDPRLGFKANYISVACEASVIEKPGWQEGLRRFWLSVSSYLNVFYSEARTLKGYVRMGPTYGVDQKTEKSPIRSWFWRGIPEELGHAIVLGTPYKELWSEVSEDGGQKYENLLVMDCGKWTDENKLMLKIPNDIRQIHSPRHEFNSDALSDKWIDTYPVIWPFGETS